MEKYTEGPTLDLKYLDLLAEKYPNIQEASTEIINYQALLQLPKGTEHFMSDLHGEYEAFIHIMNNASGEIRKKVDSLYGKMLTSAERAQLSTLIYYPEEKLKEIKNNQEININEWYMITIHQLIEIAHLVSIKYSRNKVRNFCHRNMPLLLTN
jgi:fructose-1,6-bisphosphatase-3